jgi:hypothetical protein
MIIGLKKSRKRRFKESSSDKKAHLYLLTSLIKSAYAQFINNNGLAGLLFKNYVQVYKRY